MKVSDMLLIAHSFSDKVYTTTSQANIESVSKTMDEKNIGALPVLSDGHLVGIISERDIVRKVVAKGQNPLYTLVFDIMTPNPTYATPENTLEECRIMMEEGRFRHLPVLKNNKLIGMISVRDVLVALIKEKDDLADHFQRYLVANH